jgi:ubiquinone biosynthesis protein UbiJ
MDPTLGQWLPVIVMTLAILFGLLYNNRRLDDFRELLKSEVARSENNVLRVLAESEIKLRSLLSATESQLRGAISESETKLLRTLGESENNLRGQMEASEKTVLEAIQELRVDVAKLEARVANLERPLISRP